MTGSTCIMAQEIRPAGHQEIRPAKRWLDELHPVRPLFCSDTVTVRFLGDVMMHSKQIAEAEGKDGSFDFTSYFRLIRDRLKDADLAVANMEFALGGEPYSGYPAFSAPDGIAEYVAECGIDIFLAANNHIFDKGSAGAARTMGIYSGLELTHNVRYTGLSSDPEDEKTNHPLMTSVRGIRLAMVNFTYATNGGRRKGWPKVNYMDDKEDISLALETSRRKKADLTIALPHWGNEYELLHSAAQEEMAMSLIEEGAGLIVGAHPHVVQDTTLVRTRKDGKCVPVIYSLGNAVSNMSAKNTQLELMATVRIVRNPDGKVTVMTPELTFLWCSRPGGFDSRYTVVPVEEYLDKEELWLNAADYRNMKETYYRVKKTTGIE